MSKMKNITISSGITEFKKEKVLHALIHNHRLEQSHKNIKNNNTNYFFNFKTMEIEKVKISADKKADRAKTRARARAVYKKHLDKQMALMIKRNEEKGVRKPYEKDLNPIAEGIVNFGNVYDIRNATKEERIANTKRFNEQYSEEEWKAIFEDIKNNLMEFARAEKIELLDITLHRDEEGLIHAHYLITNYNPETGEHLNIRRNKNGIGDRLQDKMAQNMEIWDLHRAKGRNGKKKLTKEQLIALRNEKDELETTKLELEKTKNELRVLKNSMKEVKKESKKIIEILKFFIDELSTIDPNDKYGAKAKIEKLLKSAKYAIGKGKMDVAQSKLDHLEKILKAMDKKGKTKGMSKKLNNMLAPNINDE